MSDDLEFLRARVPGYNEYGEEESRHDTDMRIRAFVGERLTDTQTRLAPLDEPTQKIADDVLMRCMFTDQAFVKKFEHAVLSDELHAALIHADRSLVEAGERLVACGAEEFPALLDSIQSQLDHRSTPLPTPAP